MHGMKLIRVGLGRGVSEASCARRQLFGLIHGAKQPACSGFASANARGGPRHNSDARFGVGPSARRWQRRRWH